MQLSSEYANERVHRERGRTGTGTGPGPGRTVILRAAPREQLVEDVVVAFALLLVDHSRLLQQVYTRAVHFISLQFTTLHIRCRATQLKRVIDARPSEEQLRAVAVGHASRLRTLFDVSAGDFAARAEVDADELALRTEHFTMNFSLSLSLFL